MSPKLRRAYAIVDRRDRVALFSGQCPVYWNRSVAKSECVRHNGDELPKRFFVKAIYLGVFVDAGGPPEGVR